MERKVFETLKAVCESIEIQTNPGEFTFFSFVKKGEFGTPIHLVLPHLEGESDTTCFIRIIQKRFCSDTEDYTDRYAVFKTLVWLLGIDGLNQLLTLIRSNPKEIKPIPNFPLNASCPGWEN